MSIPPRRPATARVGIKRVVNVIRCMVIVWLRECEEKKGRAMGRFTHSVKTIRQDWSVYIVGKVDD
jgi:hypothetical protein